MKKTKRIISALISAVLSISCFAATCAAEDAAENTSTKHGVTTNTVVGGVKTTVTQTKTSSGESWMYIGEVEVSDRLKKVEIVVPADMKSNYVAVDDLQTWGDETAGTIGKQTYDALFKTNEILRCHESDGWSHNGQTVDVTEEVKGNVSSETAYIYSWVEATATTKVIATYADDYITKTEEISPDGYVTTVTYTSKSRKNDHFHIGTIDMDGLTSLTFESPAEVAEDNVTLSNDDSVFDHITGDIGEIKYDELFKINKVVPYQKHTWDRNYTIDITNLSDVQHFFAWTANAGYDIKLIAVYDRTPSLTATVENIGAYYGTDADGNEDQSTSATGFITTVTGTGSFNSISWEVKSGNDTKPFSKDITTITLNGGSSYIGMIINGLYDDSANATAEVSFTQEVK